jgi:hypothetical protein
MLLFVPVLFSSSYLTLLFPLTNSTFVFVRYWYATVVSFALFRAAEGSFERIYWRMWDAVCFLAFCTRTWNWFTACWRRISRSALGASCV